MEPSEAMVQVAWRVTGRVQGVGFRWWTRTSAVALGLRGSVRNCADGSVEIEVTGPPDVVRSFRSLLQQGPPGARVDAVRPIPTHGDPPPDSRVTF